MIELEDKIKLEKYLDDIRNQIENDAKERKFDRFGCYSLELWSIHNNYYLNITKEYPPKDSDYNLEIFLTLKLNDFHINVKESFNKQKEKFLAYIIEMKKTLEI